MLFNSNLFLYLFFPALLAIYFGTTLVYRKCMACGSENLTKDRADIAANHAGNWILLIFSLLFYACTGLRFLGLLILMVLVNYGIGLSMDTSDGRRRRIILILGAAANLGCLFVFKYLIFTLDNFFVLLNRLGNGGFKNTLSIMLPVGISFYLFQSLSYIIDVYRGKVEIQRSFFKLLLYVSFFPQLIAGPIVRYSTVQQEIDHRRLKFDDIYYGMCRFCFGLGKKVLIADFLGKTVDEIFALHYATFTTPLAWAGAMLYTLQIYYDFSGYSDMAIGMGRIFGFHFDENFILPYSSKNVTEFWRRWHISLSSFLRDYLYIPLGGSRRGAVRTYRNLLIVFLLCGLWHGAAWTFIFWGAYHGAFLIFERVMRDRFHFQLKGIVGNAVTLLIVMAGWVFFRSNTLSDAVGYLSVMAGFDRLSGIQYFRFNYYVYGKVVAVAVFAAAAAILPFAKLRERLRGTVWQGVAAVGILFISMAFMSNASFTPFIYFQF